MKNIITDNAYQILGLTTEATQKEILKRTNELSNLLKIDEIPEFESDLNNIKDLRTEANVRESFGKLTDPKKRLQEYFFNFDSLSKEDLSDLKNGEYQDVVNRWTALSQSGSGIKSFFYKKNLALLLTIQLLKDKERESLEGSLKLWGELSKSETFWVNFSKTFNLNDDLNTNPQVVEVFRQDLPTILADIYSDISKIQGDKSIYAEFANTFQARGEKIEKDVLEKIYTEIHEAIYALDKLQVSDDGVFDDSEKDAIKKSLKVLQDQFNELVDLGLYEDSKTKILRDKASEAIHEVTLDLHNSLSETEMAQTMLEISLKLSGTLGLQHRLSQDQKNISKYKEEAELIAPIVDLVKEEHFEEALLELEKLEKTGKLSNILEYKKTLIATIAMSKQKQASAFFESGKLDSASETYLELQKLIMNNIDLFNLNTETIKDIILDIKERFSTVNASMLEQIDSYKDEIIKTANEKLGETSNEFTILAILLNSHIYPPVIDWVKRKKARNNIANVLYFVGLIALTFYGIGLLIWAFAWWYSNQD